MSFSVVLKYSDSRSPCCWNIQMLSLFTNRELFLRLRLSKWKHFWTYRTITKLLWSGGWWSCEALFKNKLCNFIMDFTAFTLQSNTKKHFIFFYQWQSVLSTHPHTIRQVCLCLQMSPPLFGGLKRNWCLFFPQSLMHIKVVRSQRNSRSLSKRDHSERKGEEKW